MRSADLLFEKRLLIADDLVLDIPQRPYLVRPGAARFVLVRPLDEHFEPEKDEPFPVVGLEANGNVYWHATTEAEWAAVRAWPRLVKGANYVHAGPRWNGLTTLQASPAGGPAVLLYYVPVRVHHFFQTILGPDEPDAYADVLGAHVAVRVVRPPTGIDPIDEPVEVPPSEEMSVDMSPIATPPRPGPTGTRSAPPPTAPAQMRENKAVLHAVELTRAMRMRLDSGVVAALPQVQLSFYERRAERAPYLYVQMLDDAFQPIAREDEQNGRLLLVLCVRNYTMVHYEWMAEGGWDDIYDDPASVRDGTVVLSNYGEREFASLPLEVVTPLGPDMRAVVRLALDVRIDPETGDAESNAFRPHALAPASLYFLASLERERNSAARRRRKTRGLPLYHTHVLLRVKRPEGVYLLNTLATLLPVMRGSADRTLDDWLRLLRDALSPAGIGATAKLSKLVAAYRIEPDTHVFLFTNGEHFVVSPFAFYATIATHATPMVRVGDVWVERGHAADMRREDGVLLFPPPIGEIILGEGPAAGKRLRTRAPMTADGAMAAWDGMLRDALAARIGDFEPLLDQIAACAAQPDGSYLLVAADGNRRSVAPAVAHAIFLHPGESRDPFVETTVAWIRDSLRADMDTRDGRILAFPAPIGEIETTPWAGKRRRA